MLYVVLVIVLTIFLFALLFLLYCCLLAGKLLDEEMQGSNYEKTGKKLSDRYW